MGKMQLVLRLNLIFFSCGLLWALTAEVFALREVRVRMPVGRARGRGRGGTHASASLTWALRGSQFSCKAVGFSGNFSFDAVAFTERLSARPRVALARCSENVCAHTSAERRPLGAGSGLSLPGGAAAARSPVPGEVTAGTLRPAPPAAAIARPARHRRQRGRAALPQQRRAVAMGTGAAAPPGGAAWPGAAVRARVPRGPARPGGSRGAEGGGVAGAGLRGRALRSSGPACGTPAAFPVAAPDPAGSNVLHRGEKQLMKRGVNSGRLPPPGLARPRLVTSTR